MTRAELALSIILTTIVGAVIIDSAVLGYKRDGELAYYQNLRFQAREIINDTLGASTWEEHPILTLLFGPFKMIGKEIGCCAGYAYRRAKFGPNKEKVSIIYSKERVEIIRADDVTTSDGEFENFACC